MKTKININSNKYYKWHNIAIQFNFNLHPTTVFLNMLAWAINSYMDGGYLLFLSMVEIKFFFLKGKISLANTSTIKDLEKVFNLKRNEIRKTDQQKKN